MATKIQLRRDTAANWTNANPTLAQGEPGYELDTGRMKYGNGTSTWNSLSYNTGSSGYTGSKGAIGYTGSAGTAGANGSIGYTGSAGTNGSAGATGATGYTGSAGTAGTNGSAGATGYTGSTGHGFVWQGAWDAQASYTSDTDIVSYNGSTYIKIGGDGNSGSSPDIDNVRWQLYTAKGTDGGGTTYDQSLNTNDNVAFNSLNTVAIRQGAAAELRSGLNVEVLGGSNTLVFTASPWMTSIKLVFAVEGNLDFDATSPPVQHTQTCEATIAATFNTSAEPVMSVYGTVYTTPTPLATFSVRRAANNDIEVLATNSQTSSTLHVRVHVTQFVSYYD